MKHLPITRFLRQIRVSENKLYQNSPCWEWIGSCHPITWYTDFQAIAPNGQRCSNAHRFSYAYFIGEIPDGLEAEFRPLGT